MTLKMSLRGVSDNQVIVNVEELQREPRKKIGFWVSFLGVVSFLRGLLSYPFLFFWTPHA